MDAVILSALAERFGEWVYGILFAIVFAETGLVVTPLLPGDSSPAWRTCTPGASSSP